MDSVLRLSRLPRFRNAYLFRGIAVWGGLRLALLAFGVSDPGVLERAVILMVAGSAVLFDAKRREEDVFLGNLGIRSGAMIWIALAVPAVMELVVL